LDPKALLSDPILLAKFNEVVKGAGVEPESARTDVSGDLSALLTIPAYMTEKHGLQQGFELSAAGDLRLKQKKRLTFERWHDARFTKICALPQNTLAQRAVKKQMVAYVRLIVQKRAYIEWEACMEFEDDILEMLRTGELSTLDESELLNRFTVFYSHRTIRAANSKPQQRQNQSGSSKKHTKVCSFFKSTAGCKKGDKCNFKHE
jgi:hypothetical protein